MFSWTLCLCSVQTEWCNSVETFVVVPSGWRGHMQCPVSYLYHQSYVSLSVSGDTVLLELVARFMWEVIGIVLAVAGSNYIVVGSCN